MSDDLSTEHVIVPFLTDGYLNALFDGLDNPMDTFAEEQYWKNAEALSILMAADMAEHYRYKDAKTVIGDLGEMFIGAVLEEFPTAFQIKPGSVRFCEPDQKGYDIEAFNVIDGCLMRIQVKFYCPYRPFGEGKEELSQAIRKLDSFVASTAVDGEIYYKKHRLLITTAAGIHYEVCEIGDFQSKMLVFARADLKHIIQGNSTATSFFWVRFRDQLMEAIHATIPLPTPPVPYQEQLEDINSIITEIDGGNNATLISTVGTGKTVVGFAVAAKMLKD